MRRLRYILVFLSIFFFSCKNQDTEYVCPPCNLPCDGLTFKPAGACPHCKMELTTKKELEKSMPKPLNEIAFQQGSGKFAVESAIDSSKTIVVHYHKPENFSKYSNTILILPGAGRNGKDYRDAWVEASKKYGVLVLAMEFSESHYPGFWSYNLAGMITDVNIQNQSFAINLNSSEWIFNDFDRIFNAVKLKLDLNHDSYDMFGHSAGGQLLHRLALFKPNSKADRIVASNAGWYTLPLDNEDFPYGLNNSSMKESEVDYSSKLTILLGEKDDASETRGHLRRSPNVDTQGVHRLARGTYFFETSQLMAKTLNKKLNWRLEIIPNIGHDYVEMGKKAADYLYGNALPVGIEKQ